MPRSSKPRRSASAHPANPARTGQPSTTPSRRPTQTVGDPRAEASYRAGITAAQDGRADEAIGHLASALHLGADQPRYWLSLATALLKVSRHIEARAVLERFAERAFDDPGTLAAKGQIVQVLWSEASVLHTAGRLEEAETLCDTIILLDPEHADALQLAGDIAAKTNRPDLARDLVQLAIARNPTVLPYHLLLGRILVSENDWEGAAHAYSAAIEAHPEEAELYYNLGVALASLQRFEEAIVRYAQALERDPSYVQARNNLATTLQRCGRLQEALDCFKRVETERPDHRIKANIASVLKDMGRVSEAIALFDEAIRMEPNYGTHHSSRLLTKMYLAETSAAELLADARLFGECVADPLIRRRPFANDRDPERRLRIGFISGDFCNHSVMFFFEPALQNLDPTFFEVFAYSNTPRVDATTMRLKGTFDHWRDIRWLSDEAACDLIEADRIDILVDLSGHTGGHRLLVLARKPAPVQIGWIGYNGTSGMAAMDFRFVDLAEPEGAERFSTETLWRLPGIAATYQPNPACPAPPPAPPADAAGYVTFGCINNFSKVNDDVLSVWAELLRSVPDSRLILRIAGIENPTYRAETEARLERLGLPPSRVTLEPRVNENQYDIYGQIDIALDPFPYNGVTTTMDALWMGVPVVALEGSHVAARMGLAILTNAGLPELVASSREEYIALARDIALDRDRLRTLRHDLRGRMARSPLVDHAALAGHVGAAFRDMWRSWVAQNAEGPCAVSDAPAFALPVPALPVPALPAPPSVGASDPVADPPKRTLPSIVEALSLLTPYDIDRAKVRIGPNGDGGYVFADGLSPDQAVLSYGISTEYQFDAEMAARGHQVYMFDHTIRGINRTHDTMRFFKEGVGPAPDPVAKVSSIDDHLARHGIAGDRLILKMDVEGAEFESLVALSDANLRRFEQIVIEVHWLGRLGDAAYRAQFARLFTKLNGTHTLFHVHANNYDGPDTLNIVDGILVSNLLELSYIRTDSVDRRPSQTIYPTHLDFPNVGTRDKLLWFFPFLPTPAPAAEFDARWHRNQLLSEALLRNQHTATQARAAR